MPFVPRDPRDVFRAHSSDLYDAIEAYIGITTDKSDKEFAKILRAKVNTHLDAMMMMFNCEHVHHYKAVEELKRKEDRADEADRLLVQLTRAEEAIDEMAKSGANFVRHVNFHLDTLRTTKEIHDRRLQRERAKQEMVEANRHAEAEKKRVLGDQLKEMRKKQKTSE